VKERSRARGWALQTLYAWESRGAPEEEMVSVLSDLSEELRIAPRNRAYAEVLVRLAGRHLPQVDRIVQRNLTNWSLRRLAVVDRNILRLGVLEMLYVDDVPPRVTIREMMRLAERYGTPESPRFVNGVLDAVMREIDAEGPATAP
jgi:transcription antitermination protein NusB